VFAADDKTAKTKYTGAAFYQAKQYLLPLLDRPVTFAPLEANDSPRESPYQMGRSAYIKRDGQIIGIVGEFRASVRKALKLPDYSAGFELDISVLREQAKSRPYQVLSTFPKIQQDLTIEVPENVQFGDIYQTAQEALSASQADHGYQATMIPRDIFKAHDSDKKRITLRIWVSHPSRTLKTEEVNSLLDSIAGKLAASASAVRI
jgi:phenylalanyl-tRNA synthetase beta chain